MIRIAVCSSYDSFHRRLWRAVEPTEDLRVDVRFRAVRQLTPTPRVDVIVLHGGSAELIGAAMEVEADVGMLVVGPEARLDSLSAALSARGGAFGVVADGADAALLCSAIRAVAAGLTAYGPQLLAPAADLSVPSAADEEGLQLTNREHQVLTLLGQGRSNAEISEELSISENTVKYHLSALYGALNVHRRGDAVLAALRRGLISL